MNTPDADENRSAEESSTIAAARRLVLRYGWNSTAYQIINPGIAHWFAAANDAVVGFVSAGGMRVVVGAPVCTENRLRAVVGEFERDAARTGERVCYVCAERRMEAFCDANAATHTKILLGAQPVWTPGNWTAIVARHKSLRAQLNRARNKGVAVSEWSNEKAAKHPALLDCLHKWLAAKGLPPLHFMVEPDTLSRLFDRRVFVAKCDSKAVGFVTLSPVPARSGWLFEQFVHCPGAPNGTVELMIDCAMRAASDAGSQYATLGLAPLSNRARASAFRNPLWLKILLAWLRLHGRRFYNFDGLDCFKAKLQPERWEPVFAVSNEKRLSPKTIYAVACAFSENAPFRLVFSGLGRAAKTEIDWFKDKIRKKL